MALDPATIHHLKRIADSLERMQKIAEWEVLDRTPLGIDEIKLQRHTRLEQSLWPERHQ